MKKITIIAVFVILFGIIILSFFTPLGTYLYNEDVRYLRNAEDYLNAFYPVNEDKLQGAMVMINANHLNYGSRLSLRLENLNDAFIDIYNELDSAMYNKGVSYKLMNYHIDRSNSLMEFAIEILEDL